MPTIRVDRQEPDLHYPAPLQYPLGERLHGAVGPMIDTVKSFGSFNSGVSGAYSAWQQITAGLDQDIFLPFMPLCNVVLPSTNTTGNYVDVQFGFGPAGSETVFYEQVAAPFLRRSAGGEAMFDTPRPAVPLAFPIWIPAGTRLAVRSATEFTVAAPMSGDLIVMPTRIASPLWPQFVHAPTRRVTGAQSGYRRGSALTATANPANGGTSIYGGWTELKSAMPKDAYICHLGNVSWDISASHQQLDIGFGPSGAERTVYTAVQYNPTALTTANVNHGSIPTIVHPSLYVSKGTRVAARSLNDSISGGNKLDVHYIAVEDVWPVAAIGGF